MPIYSAFVLYAVLWFLILLMVLPLGVRSQEEVGDVAPGTPAGAPAESRILLKMLWATIGAGAALAAIWGIIEYEVITQADIMRLSPFETEW